MTRYASWSGLAMGLALSIAMALVARVEKAQACSCSYLPPSELLVLSDAAFVGTVTAVRRVVGNPYKLSRPLVWLETTLVVTRIWKGEPRMTYELLTLPPSAGSCSSELLLGGTYLVYAERRTEPFRREIEFTTSRCLGTRAIEWTQADLAELGPGVSLGNACPQLAGRVPPDIVAAALDDPAAFGGWGRLANEGRPPSPYNPYRTWLSIRSPSTPFGPMNGLIWKASCR